MEILRRAHSAFKFKVLRNFVWGQATVKPGQEIEVKDRLEQDAMVLARRITPADIPAIGTYVCLKSFSLPGQDEKHSAKAMELVSLKAEDALRLMLEAAVIPKDEYQWRPKNRRLRLKPDQTPQERMNLGLQPAQKKRPR